MENIVETVQKTKLELLEQEGVAVINNQQVDQALLLQCIPHYKGNLGFYHIISPTFGEFILLKSCYSDFVRWIKKGAKPLNETLLQELLRTLSHVDTTTINLAPDTDKNRNSIFWFHINDGVIELAQVDDCPERGDYTPLNTIPRPLTSVEYSTTDGVGYLHETTILSRSLFQTVCPEILTHTMTSLLERYPDIASTFFLFLDAKVQSPSIKVINKRGYVNISGLDNGFSEGKVDVKAFEADFMPWQKIFKSKPKKQKLFLAKQISTLDIDNFYDEIKKMVASKSNYAFFEDDFFMPIPQIATCGMMLDLVFQELLLSLAQTLGISNDEALKIIYTTRESSFFIKGGELSLPLFFDFNFKSRDIKISPQKAATSVDDALGKLSFMKNMFGKSKAKNFIHRAHHTLDCRDRITVQAGLFHKKCADIVNGFGNDLVTNKKFKQPSDVYLTPLADLRKLINGSYFTSLEAILIYNSSYGHRAKSQRMPYELYDGDIKFAGKIAEEQMEKINNSAEYRCRSRNHHPDISGAIHTVMLEDGDDKYNGLVNNAICCSRAITLPMLADGVRPLAFITDIAPALSYITEYCMINDIPLYYGVKQSTLTFHGKSVTLYKDKIVAG